MKKISPKQLDRGPEAALKIIQMMNPQEQERLLSDLAARDPALSDYLRKNLIQLEDLIYLTPKMAQHFLRKIQLPLLALALRTASQQLRDFLAQNMSSNMRQDFMDQFKSGPKPMREVQKAQAELLEVVHLMVARGELVINPQGRDELV